MYILLILLHSLFILITHLFGFYIIEGVFLVLMLFFLLYFSPIFFFKKQTADGKNNFSELFSFELSPQKSLIIPLVLTYIGIYILAFTFSANISQSIHTHLIIFLGIFVLFLGYIFAFEWKNSVFFDILGFHLVFSYITLIISGMYYFFVRDGINFLDVIFVITTFLFSYFFFRFETRYRKEFFGAFLISLLFSLKILLLFVFPNSSFSLIIGILGIFAILIFEMSEKHNFFKPFFHITRISSLSFVIFSAFLLFFIIFWEFYSIYFLLVFIAFFFSVHIRFSNVITYGSGIFGIYFLYAFIFLSLLSADSPFSSLSFIYFFPILIIINTYFWEEKQKYDFAIIHYASIAFGGIFFLYSLLFINWDKNFFIFSSFGFLLLAILFFLSYFRFYNKK